MKGVGAEYQLFGFLVFELPESCGSRRVAGLSRSWCRCACYDTPSFVTVEFPRSHAGVAVETSQPPFEGMTPAKKRPSKPSTLEFKNSQYFNRTFISCDIAIPRLAQGRVVGP